MTVYKNQIFDEERALYGVQDARIAHCTFDGPADGESALKESKNITVSDCDFRLRYPFWHVTGAVVEDCRMTGTCRASIWYAQDITLKNCQMMGIKAVRECKDVVIENSNINSMEFGWLSYGITIKDTELDSEYPFFHAGNMQIDRLTMHGKYSFQYVEGVEIRNSSLETKDAFWHSKNVTVFDSVIKGEYLGWYSENLKLVRCKIIGTQPLCYAKNLVMEDCEMIDCDLSFERSSVKADVIGQITQGKLI